MQTARAAWSVPATRRARSSAPSTTASSSPPAPPPSSSPFPPPTSPPLIIAPGSPPFMLPIPGTDLQGVLTYRDMADTRAMIAAAASYRHAVVIGGGLLGLEAANGLMKRGMQGTGVHVGDWLLEGQLDGVAGKMLQQSVQERGMQFLLGAQTQALLGHADGHGNGHGQGQGAAPRVRAVRFKDGSELPADLVVMAVGIRPNTALAERMRLHVQRGIVVS